MRTFDKTKALPLLVTLDDALDVGYSKWGNDQGHLCIESDADTGHIDKLILRTGLATHGFEILVCEYHEWFKDEDDPDSEIVCDMHFETSMTICQYNAFTEADPKACMTCVCPACKAVAH